MMNRLVVPLFALLLCPMVLHGQSTSARLSGVVLFDLPLKFLVRNSERTTKEA
jgi:hypothetical protein